MDRMSLLSTLSSNGRSIPSTIEPEFLRLLFQALPALQRPVSHLRSEVHCWQYPQPQAASGLSGLALNHQKQDVVEEARINHLVLKTINSKHNH
jgi:hypothetical protein